MTRAKLAEKYFIDGYACSQAVVLAFCDLTNIEKEDLLKLTLPLGGGLSRLRLTCGAINALAIIIGLVFSSDCFTEENKLYIYEKTREVINRFEKKWGTINCKELLEKASLDVEIGGIPEKRSAEYYQKRPCGKIVYSAALVLEEYLKEQNKL
ncbi:MAG: C_GCAxxG_C_C family protein [Bacilli bacterium]|nr:C_GCAxxG_C_C family protein [Bacilli bacterium]